MFTKCPYCGADWIEGLLHPFEYECYWCQYTLNYRNIDLSQSFDFYHNCRPCYGCGYVESVEILDNGYCLRCMSDDNWIYDDERENHEC
jgi:hypothetical protein